MIRIGADLFFGSEDAVRIAAAYLPCLRCSAKGPHARTFEVAGGVVAVCQSCEPHMGQDALHDRTHMLQVAAPAAGVGE